MQIYRESVGDFPHLRWKVLGWTCQINSQSDIFVFTAEMSFGSYRKADVLSLPQRCTVVCVFASQLWFTSPKVRCQANQGNEQVNIFHFWVFNHDYNAMFGTQNMQIFMDLDICSYNCILTFIIYCDMYSVSCYLQCFLTSVYIVYLDIYSVSWYVWCILISIQCILISIQCIFITIVHLDIYSGCTFLQVASATGVRVVK